MYGELHIFLAQKNGNNCLFQTHLRILNKNSKESILDRVYAKLHHDA